MARDVLKMRETITAEDGGGKGPDVLFWGQQVDETREAWDGLHVNIVNVNTVNSITDTRFNGGRPRGGDFAAQTTSNLKS